MGTQKSYAKSEVTREKRRRYEAKRRRKRALMADSKDLNTEEVLYFIFFFNYGLAQKRNHRRLSYFPKAQLIDLDILMHISGK